MVTNLPDEGMDAGIGGKLRHRQGVEALFGVFEAAKQAQHLGTDNGRGPPLWRPFGLLVQRAVEAAQRQRAVLLRELRLAVLRLPAGPEIELRKLGVIGAGPLAQISREIVG